MEPDENIGWLPYAILTAIIVAIYLLAFIVWVILESRKKKPAAADVEKGDSLEQKKNQTKQLKPATDLEKGVVVMGRVVIPDDNSCLFNAVGYVMDHDQTKAAELRQVIAATVVSNPEKYSEKFLGKPNAEYCNWILDSENCGGAIELSILADYYGREIAVYDIQTTRCDLYGQEGNYSERVMLIYDGLHYDALAMSSVEGATKDFDQTIFAIQTIRSIGTVEELALNFIEDQHKKWRFTGAAKFTPRCGICQIGVIDLKGAEEHARATGHVNFQLI